MTTADRTSVPPRANASPRFDRYHVGDRVLLGVSAVVDDQRDPEVAQVSLVGELCPASTPRLAAMLEALVEDGIRKVHVDLAQLDLCTAAGVTLFDEVASQLRARGGSLELVNARGVVHRVLELTEIPHHHADA